MAKTYSLWPKSDCLLQISEEVALAFPLAFVQNPVAYARRTRELGYNALVLGQHDLSAKRGEGNFAQLEKALHLCKEQGLSLIVKPSVSCPADLPTFCKRLPFFGAIFWESGLRHPAYDSSDLTQGDLLLREMKRIEESLPDQMRLIFYVPTDLRHPKRQVRCLTSLCEEALPKTTIAFSALQGDPWQDHLPLHPFWSAPHLSTTPLMPLMNLGLIGLGEGRWPTVPFDLFERCLMRSIGSPFEGPIALVNQLPGYGGTLECSLWMGSQQMTLGAELLAEKWLKSRRPALSFESWRALMQKGRAIALEMRLLQETSKEKKQLLRLQIESLLSRLKYEQSFYENSRESGLCDYFSLFAEEALQFLAQYSKGSNIPFLNGYIVEEKKSILKAKILEENLFPLNQLV